MTAGVQSLVMKIKRAETPGYARVKRLLRAVKAGVDPFGLALLVSHEQEQ